MKITWMSPKDKKYKEIAKLLGHATNFEDENVWLRAECTRLEQYNAERQKHYDDTVEQLVLLHTLLTEARGFLQTEYDENLDDKGMIALGEFLPRIDAVLSPKGSEGEK